MPIATYISSQRSPFEDTAHFQVKVNPGQLVFGDVESKRFVQEMMVKTLKYFAFA